MRALISTRILNFRGGILEQLAAGIRLLELDVHNFTIGHGFPCEGAPQYGLTIEACEAERPCHGAGCEVDHGDPETDTEGNTTTNTLVDWLHQVSVWSAQHPTHSPITICLDIKEVYGPWLGFGPWLGALDTMVRKEFSSIYTPAELAVHKQVARTEQIKRIAVSWRETLTSQISAAPSTGATALVVQDGTRAIDPVVLESLRSALHGFGYEVIGDHVLIEDAEREILFTAGARKAIGLSDPTDGEAVARLQDYLDASDGLAAIVWVVPDPEGPKRSFQYRALMRRDAQELAPGELVLERD